MASDQLIRVAVPGAEDLKVWRMLWREYIEAEGVYVPNEQTLAFFERIYSPYVMGLAKGVVLLAEEEAGVLMWGEILGAPRSVYGRIAVGFGTYVRDSHRRMGVGRLLRETAVQLLREMGFVGVQGTARLSNTAGRESARAAGFVPVGEELLLWFEREK